MKTWQAQYSSRFFKIIRADNKDVVGVCGLNLAKKEVLLFNLYIIPRFRGMGFGEAAKNERERMIKELVEKRYGGAALFMALSTFIGEKQDTHFGFLEKVTGLSVRV